MTPLPPSTHDTAQFLDYHVSMLRDTVRTNAFREAIHATVVEGDVVVDIGCGTGILSLFACQAGARHVYAIDRGPVLDVARDLARRNGLADRISFLRGESTVLDPPERADVLITETLWNLGLGEGLLSTVSDAVRRWLRPGAAIIPGTVEVRLAPIGLRGLHERLSVADLDYGVDFSHLEAASRNVPRSMFIWPEAVRCPAQTVWSARLPYGGPETIPMAAEFVVETAGTVNAFGGWFRSDLGGGVVLSNAPPSAAPSWEQAVFPLSHAVEVAPGDRIRVALETDATADTTWTWATRVLRDGAEVAAFQQSTRDVRLLKSI